MAQTAGGLTLGGDVELALAGMLVPSYVLDTAGFVRWINPAAKRLLGDVRGRHFTSVVGPEDRTRAKELFARKVLDTTAATEATGVLVSADGTRVALEVSAVPLMGGERVVGVFGLLTGPLEENAGEPPAHLTPRQAEVLHLLEQGARRSRLRRSSTSARKRSGITSAISCEPSERPRVSKPSPPPGTPGPPKHAEVDVKWIANRSHAR
jgi:PAS domain S-box-containing protein